MRQGSPCLAAVAAGRGCRSQGRLRPMHPDAEARARYDVGPDALPGDGRHVEASQLALTAIPHDDLDEAVLRHREHVEGDERIHASRVGPIPVAR
jgi:hypothetical protein